MTELLDEAVATARALPPDRQDHIARAVMALVGDGEPVIDLTPDEEADLIEAQAERARGEFASADEVQAVLSKYRA